MPLFVSAATVDQLNQQKNAAQQQAAAAQQQAAAKQQEASFINEQLAKINSQVAGLQKDIDATDVQISETQKTIDDLKAQIKIQEDNLVIENNKLNQLLASWYMEGDSSSLTNTILSSNTLSEVVTKNEYYDSINQQIENSINKINQLRADLEKQKSEQDSKLLQLKDLQNQQELQRQSLQSQQWVKHRLLNDTTKMVAELKSQSADATKKAQQIQQQINDLSARTNYGGDIVSGGVPWYYRQLDYYTEIDHSGLTVHDYGCALTSAAMIATYYGNVVTPPQVAQMDGLFGSGGDINWSNLSRIGLRISSGGWNDVDSQIAQGRPVIVSLAIPGSQFSNSDGSSHFIVIWGKSGDKYLMADPIAPSGRSYSASQVRSIKIVSPY